MEQKTIQPDGINDEDTALGVEWSSRAHSLTER
jgi:hypothetical protein